MCAIVDLPAEVLAAPDYRSYTHNVGQSLADPQRLGLPTVMLDTLARQHELLVALLESGMFRAGENAETNIARLMPQTVLVRAIAGGLLRKAQLGETPFDWQERFVRADVRLASQWASTQSVLLAINEGKNPLGIEDEDLPLYFLADEAAGAGGRFGAVSDFILGSGPGANAWAPSLVSQANRALEDARMSYISQADREYLVARDQRDHERWVGEVRDEYNAQLRDYCGPIEESLIDNPNFHAGSCFVNRSQAQCRVEERYWHRWRERDLLGRACFANSLNGFSDDAEEAWMDGCFEGFPRDTSPRAADVLEKVTCGDRTCLRCVGKPELGELPLSVESLQVKMPAFRTPRARTSALERVTRVCRSRYPAMRLNPPVPKPNPLDQPECVRGTLGEHQLDVVASVNAVAAARTAMAEFTEAYRIAIDGCVLLETDASMRDALINTHNENMTGLVAARTVADSAATAAAGVKDCAATAAGSDKSNPFSAIASSAGIAVTCVAAGVETAAAITSLGIEAGIENAERMHDAAITAFDAQSEIRQCYNDARLELVGLKSAQHEIRQALFDLRRARATVEQEILDAQRIWADGHSYLSEIEGFPVKPPSGDLWVDERVSTYVRRFKLARRASYLAVRAVEYEYQQTLGQRQAVLEAETPDDLESVLQELWTASGTRTVGGSRPSELHVVLSLRDDILRIADESERPSELNPLSSAERFRVELSSPKNAVYDDDGRWLGQRIPFDLVPLGAYGLETNGVPIYSTGDCAERVWSVNASILGSDVIEGSASTFVRVDLEKDNTFFSQWCGDAPADAPFQTASVRPTRNLFREPGVGESVGESFGVEQGLTGASRARIQAFLNVDRATMEDPTYANGETSELAARGLFGRYAIFVPADLIAEESSNGGFTNGIVFDRVDDILLRFDYVSVAE